MRRERGSVTATIRVHRLSFFVVPLHCTRGPPLVPLESEDEDEDAVGEGGLDAARGRLVGV